MRKGSQTRGRHPEKGVVSSGKKIYLVHRYQEQATEDYDIQEEQDGKHHPMLNTNLLSYHFALLPLGTICSRYTVKDYTIVDN